MCVCVCMLLASLLQMGRPTALHLIQPSQVFLWKCCQPNWSAFAHPCSFKIRKGALHNNSGIHWQKCLSENATQKPFLGLKMWCYVSVTKWRCNWDDQEELFQRPQITAILWYSRLGHRGVWLPNPGKRLLNPVKYTISHIIYYLH